MHRDRLRFAVVIENAFSSFHADLKTGVDRYLTEANLDAVYFGVGSLDDANPLDRARMALLEMISPNEFDGLIFVPSAKYRTTAKERLRQVIASLGDMPRVTIGPSLFGEDSVCFDNDAGMRAVMRHLIEDHGYRRFAYVSGPFSNAEAVIRIGAYRSELDRAGIPHCSDSEFEGNFLSNSGQDAVAYFLDKKKLSPEAIVCANDRMALGAWNALESRGMRVPFDIALTGYDDTQLSHALSNQFTTVNQSFDRLGFLAASRLHAFARGKRPSEPETLPIELRVRSSCGCVDYKRRGVSEVNVAGDDERLRGIRDTIIEYIRGGCPPRAEKEFYRMWIETVLRAIGKGESAHWLERCLMSIPPSLRDSASAARASSLVPTLYSLMIEQCGQKAFVDYWDDKTYMYELRVLFERLYGAIMEPEATGESRGIIDRIMGLSGADSFYLVRFEDPADIGKGATVSYSVAPDTGDWKPGPGSWIPPGARSLVANVVSTGDNRFVYLLVDANVANTQSFDFFRLHVSGLVQSVSSAREIDSLKESVRGLSARIAELERERLAPREPVGRGE